jgi:dienelactone hydrolase
MRKPFTLGGLLCLMIALPLAAAEFYDAGNLPIDKNRDLAFPAVPQAFGKANGNRLFKPDGPGPFSALVLLPVCSGHGKWYQLFDWAKAALDRGYAVLVVDPLTPRGVGVENCLAQKVNLTRFRKDGFDAAEHLRKQPFVKHDRIGLLGQSQGAMAALSASGEAHSTPDGRPAFRAIVSLYPLCNLPNYRSIVLKRVVDMRFLPIKVVVPLQVQMGELDNEAPPKDCVPLLEEQKSKGAPVDFVVHKNATHNWDTSALGSTTFTKPAPPWSPGQKTIAYRYNAQVTADSMKRAFEFFDQHLKGSQ